MSHTSHTFRLNNQALNRGVDEVLLLKPVRRAVHQMLHGRAATGPVTTTTAGSSETIIIRAPKTAPAGEKNSKK